MSDSDDDHYDDFIAAIDANDPDSVRALLRRDATPESKLIHYACRKHYQNGSKSMNNDHNAEIVKMLIDAGGYHDLNTPAHEYGRTPLDAAIIACRLATARHLLAAGADINLRDGMRYNVLHVALYAGPEAVRFVLSHPDFDLDGDGLLYPLFAQGDYETILHRAAQVAKQEAVFDALMEFPAVAALLDRAEMDGSTPLHRAFFWANRTAARALLRHGAKAHLVNDKGQTAIEVEQHRIVHRIARNRAPIPEDIVEAVRKTRDSVGKTIKAAGRHSKKAAKRKREAEPSSE